MGVKGTVSIRTSTYGSPEHASKQYPDVGSGIGVSPVNRLPWEFTDQKQEIPIGPKPYTERGEKPPQEQAQEAGWEMETDPAKIEENRARMEALKPSMQAQAERWAQSNEIQNNQGAGTRGNFPSGTYPANPTPMQGAGDNPQTGAVMPKLQVQGDVGATYGTQPAERGGPPVGESLTHPGMDRTAIGDKWQPGHTAQGREGGRDYIDASIIGHADMVDQSMGARGFVRNEIADFGGPLRYEHKMTGDFAVTEGGRDGYITVSFYDRAGTLLFQANTFSGIDGFLGERFPNGDLDLLRRYFTQLLANPEFTWHEFLVKHPASVDHYHGRRGRAYSAQTGMRIPQERHTVDARPRTGGYGGYAGLDEEKHLQGAHDQATHGMRGKDISTVGSQVESQGWTPEGVGLSDRFGAQRVHRYRKPDGGKVDIHTGQGGIIVDIDEDTGQGYSVPKHKLVGGKWVPTPAEGGDPANRGGEREFSPRPETGMVEFTGEHPQPTKEPAQAPKVRAPSQRTVFDPNLYSNLRARGLNDAQVHQVQRLMISTGLSADQLAMQGYLAMPQLAEEKDVKVLQAYFTKVKYPIQAE